MKCNLCKKWLKEKEGSYYWIEGKLTSYCKNCSPKVENMSNLPEVMIIPITPKSFEKVIEKKVYSHPINYGRKGGKYIVSFQTVWRDVVANKYYYVTMYAGGSIIAQIEETAEANQIRVPVSMTQVVDLNAGDEIYIRAYHNSGTAKSLAGTGRQTVFSVAKIS